MGSGNSNSNSSGALALAGIGRPHILIHGPAGSGKTSAVHAFWRAKMLEERSLLNCSDEHAALEIHGASSHYSSTTTAKKIVSVPGTATPNTNYFSSSLAQAKDNISDTGGGPALIPKQKRSLLRMSATSFIMALS